MTKISVKRFFIILILLPVLFAFISCKETVNNAPENNQTETVKIAALLSLTGNWSSLGITSQSALKFASEDINNYLESAGSKFRVEVEVKDTKLETTLAEQFINQLASNGIKYFIGPQSSAEVAAVKNIADNSNVIVVSQGSTAGSLAIPDDNVFRFCPADSLEGFAIASTIFSQGIQALITVARNDAGNIGLQNSTGLAFSNLGGNITPLIPYNTDISDFSSLINNLKAEVASLTAIYGSGKVAVYLASFDECVDLFNQAMNEVELTSINWYGGDGVALSAAIINDSTASRFALMTNFFAPTFGLPEQARTKWEPLALKIKTETNIEPDAFALASYDALWVIMQTVMATNNNLTDIQKIKSVFQQQANSYFGVTGPTLLNAYGDRGIGSFDYWGIVNEAGVYKWKLVGKSN